MAQISVEVDDEVMPYLLALATVRRCEPGDLLRQALRHLHVTQAEKQRVAFYRFVQETGSDRLTDVYTGPRHAKWDRT